ncbi:hypothetical protein AF72_06505 [Xylella taiwanensis]|uniref:Uncharacterized protein n=1 Tax=Xylella taiwanensis TaxID=1444770 RepID=Z9JJ05_9GAMM|nr:hypothetical protein AF72_06505 [Xylella taiwanensis]
MRYAEQITGFMFDLYERATRYAGICAAHLQVRHNADPL